MSMSCSFLLWCCRRPTILCRGAPRRIRFGFCTQCNTSTRHCCCCWPRDRLGWLLVMADGVSMRQSPARCARRAAAVAALLACSSTGLAPPGHAECILLRSALCSRAHLKLPSTVQRCCRAPGCACGPHDCLQALAAAAHAGCRCVTRQRLNKHTSMQLLLPDSAPQPHSRTFRCRGLRGSLQQTAWAPPKRAGKTPTATPPPPPLPPRRWCRHGAFSPPLPPPTPPCPSHPLAAAGATTSWTASMPPWLSTTATAAGSSRMWVLAAATTTTTAQ